MKRQTAKETDYLDAFSKQVRKILKENKLTQKQLAQATGVTPNAVNEWVRGKRQPKWLLQMFSTIKFFYENVEGFNPMQLFFIEDFDLTLNGDEPLSTSIDVIIDSREQKIKADCAQQIRQVEDKAKKEIEEIKAKYQTYEIDKLLNEIEKLKKQISSVPPKTNYGRQDYEQFKEKLNKKYDKLKREYEEYKDAYNGLTLTELTEQELENLSKSLTIKSSIGDGKRRMKNLLTNPEFYKLLKKVFIECLYAKANNNNNCTKQFSEDIGNELFNIILLITPYDPIYLND